MKLLRLIFALSLVSLLQAANNLKRRQSNEISLKQQADNLIPESTQPIEKKIEEETIENIQSSTTLTREPVSSSTLCIIYAVMILTVAMGTYSAYTNVNLDSAILGLVAGLFVFLCVLECFKR